MAEPATIARPYAEALFQAITGAGADPISTATLLDELAALADHPELRQLAGNPKVTADQMFALFQEVREAAARPALSVMAGNFLRTVIANRRLGVLAQVAQQFRALLNRRNDSSDAVVYSAFYLDSAAMSELGAALQKRFGRKLNLTLRADPSLIGGIRVVVGDEVLDSSVKARLEQMKAALTA